jgi:ketosteroid isomerase-like protein
MTTTSTIPAAVTAYFDAINADRFGDLRSVFAPDIVIQMGGAAPRVGVDAAIAYYPRALATIPVHRDEPVAVLVGADGRKVSVEIAFTGRTSDDRPVDFSAVDLFDLDADGRVTRLRSFYDTAAVVRQLGPSG